MIHEFLFMALLHNFKYLFHVEDFLEYDPVILTGTPSEDALSIEDRFFFTKIESEAVIVIVLSLIVLIYLGAVTLDKLRSLVTAKFTYEEDE